MKNNIEGFVQKFSLFTAFTFFSVCLGCSSSSAKDGYIRDQYGALNVKEVYLKEIQEMSFSQIKQRLNDDSHALSIAMDSLRDFRFNVSARISLQSYDKNVENAVKEVNHFHLLAKDFVEQELHSVTDVKFTQVYRYPHSGFRFNFSSLKEVLNANNVEITPVELYGNKKKFNLESVAMQTIDSIRTDLKFSYPTNYDSIVIDRRKEPEIKYGDDKIVFRYIDDSELRLQVPPGINIIGNRGFSKDGSVLSAKSSSVMPVLVIRPEVEGIVQKIKQQFDRAVQAKSQEEAVEILKELTEEEFIYATKLTRGARILDEFYGLAKYHYQTIMSMLSKLQEDYRLILQEDYVKYDFEYDRTIEKVVLYIGKEYDMVSKTITAKNWKTFIPKYVIYQDDEYGKYGISSKEGEIIIPAQYSDLEYVSSKFVEENDVYYFERENDSEEKLYYYLDIEKRELSPLKEGMYYLWTLGEATVFENKDEDKGVLAGNKVIVPLRYDNIAISKELYIGISTKQGSLTYDFYNTAGKLISVDSFTEIDNINANSAQIIVKDDILAPK